MIWSDKKIIENKRLIDPFYESQVQPVSYDVCLDNGIYVNDEWTKLPYTMKKGDFVIASTIEKIFLPNGVCAQIDGKSTLGRKGLIIHSSAGWIDSGFFGNITLEMTLNYKSIDLFAGMPIGQIIFMDAYECNKLYNGHYQGQKGATKAYR